MVGWIVITVGLIAGGVAEFARHRRLKRFWERGCAGREWRREFPEASARQIREFLEMFVHAFGIAPKHRLAFKPRDEVMDVYRALNADGFPDNLELESLAMSLKERYGLKFEDVWREGIRLGEVFREARTRASARWL
jgi:propanediol dehydratase small subunit